MASLFVKTVPVTLFRQNARVLISEETAEAIVVDPGGDINLFWQISELDSVSVKAVLVTHLHIDHVGGVEAFVSACKERGLARPEIIFHKDDEFLLGSIARQAEMFGLERGSYLELPGADRYVADGEELEFGGLRARVLHTPGHSPGHICLFFDVAGFREAVFDYGSGRKLEEVHYRAPLLVAGDLLFSGSVGRTDLPGGSMDKLVYSIKDKVFTLPRVRWYCAVMGPTPWLNAKCRRIRMWFDADFNS